MKKTLFLFLMAVTWQGSAPAADIYVSPAGRDLDTYRQRLLEFDQFSKWPIRGQKTQEATGRQ